MQRWAGVSQRLLPTHWVVRDLFRNVVAMRAVGVVVHAAVELVQNRVVGLLHSAGQRRRMSCPPSGFDMPPREIEHEHPLEPLLGIRFVTSTVVSCVLSAAYPKIRSGCEKKSVTRSSIDLGSRTNVGSAILDKSMPGRTEVSIRLM